VATGQQLGKNKPNLNLPMKIQSCAAGGSCTSESAAVTLDAN
jgi:hypothetical protein